MQLLWPFNQGRGTLVSTVAVAMFLASSASGQTLAANKDPKRPEAGIRGPSGVFELRTPGCARPDCIAVPVDRLGSNNGVRFGPIEHDSFNVEATFCNCNESQCLADQEWPTITPSRAADANAQQWRVLMVERDLSWLRWRLRDYAPRVWRVRFTTPTKKEYFSWLLQVSIGPPAGEEVQCLK
jgi:hypothetical protein